VTDQEHREIFIIKRHPSHDEGHHGGAWKIAFADFMTAMMALFLVLWLTSSTSDKTKRAVAQYFNPVKLVDMTTERKGFRDPLETEMGSGSNIKESPTEIDMKSHRPSSGTKRDTNSQGEPTVATHTEAALFRDPFAVLAEIVAKAPTETQQASSDTASGMNGGRRDPADAFEDPFASSPRGPEHGAVPLPSRLVEKGDADGSAEGVRPPEGTDAAVLSQLPTIEPRQSQSGSISRPSTFIAQSGAADAAKLKSEITEALNKGFKTQEFPRFEVQDTAEGILISLTDDNNYSMFAMGSAEPLAKTIRVMEKIGLLLKASSGQIVIRGHTDGRPFKSATYDNWRLSSARAHMALYMLARGGLVENRVEKVEGYADHRLKSSKDPFASENRRIEILLRKDKP
jgi:chemotaxis protein MotB